MSRYLYLSLMSSDLYSHAYNRAVTRQNEVFGPVLAITSFSTDEKAIAIANSTRYRLSSNIQTRDLTRAHRIAAELEVGEVLINGAPSLAPHRRSAA
jgi:acyl-CoA reductase-like NAD-dependent aldehyde dehydrogenase